MAIRSYTFQKKQGENLKQFDSRINNMSPVHAGYAYFGARAYEVFRKFYGLYIVWEGKFNSSMNQPLTEQGYVMVCSEEDVKLFYELSHALPVYVKVQSKNGCIYAKDIYIIHNDIKYKIFYTGCHVDLPEAPYYVEISDGSDSVYIKPKVSGCINNSSYNINVSSFNMGNALTDSFNISSFNIFRTLESTYNIGSFSLSSFNVSSFNVSEFANWTLNSTYNVSSFNINSFNVSSFNAAYLLMGSFNISSFSISSFSIGSFNINNFVNGSFNVNNFVNTSFNISCSDESDMGNLASNEAISYLISEFYEVYGIGCLGYGLNLI